MTLKDIMRKNRYTYTLGKTYRFIETNIKNISFSCGAFFRHHGLAYGKYEKIKKLKDTYKGKRCFIIATGPSLTSEDILKLKNEYTFSMNSICLKYDELGWRPTFYGIQDYKVFHKLKSVMSYPDIKYIFVDGFYSNEKDVEKDNWVYFPRNAYYNGFNAYFKHEYNAKFSGDAASVVYEGFTITCSLIQIAVYLGFDKIYLLGCDCNYATPGDHFVDHGVVDPTYKESKNRMIAGYSAAKKYADSNGIKIYNATRGGMLEVFERVNLDDIV